MSEQQNVHTEHRRWTTLTSAGVRAITMDCLYREDEIVGEKAPDGAVIAEGLVRKFAFNPARLAGHAAEIADLLAELPDNFHAQRGGGWTFLNACMDRHGRQWGEHRDMEELFCLGIATGQALWLMKEMADEMPGGVPYVQVLPAQGGGR